MIWLLMVIGWFLLLFLIMPLCFMRKFFVLVCLVKTSQTLLFRSILRMALSLQRMLIFIFFLRVLWTFKPLKFGAILFLLRFLLLGGESFKFKIVCLPMINFVVVVVLWSLFVFYALILLIARLTFSLTAPLRELFGCRLRM